MQLVIITALGIGGATIAGALIGFLFKNVSQKMSDAILGFAAGVADAAQHGIEVMGEHALAKVAALGLLKGRNAGHTLDICQNQEFFHISQPPFCVFGSTLSYHNAGAKKRPDRANLSGP